MERECRFHGLRDRVLCNPKATSNDSLAHLHHALLGLYSVVELTSTCSVLQFGWKRP